MTVKWEDTGIGLCSGEARLDATGGIVYISVESLGKRAWDWLVWDDRRRTVPRYGFAYSKKAAKQQAELSVRDVTIAIFALTGVPAPPEELELGFQSTLDCDPPPSAAGRSPDP